MVAEWLRRKHRNTLLCGKDVVSTLAAAMPWGHPRSGHTLFSNSDEDDELFGDNNDNKEDDEEPTQEETVADSVEE